MAVHLIVLKIGPLTLRRSGMETYGFALKSPASLLATVGLRLGQFQAS